MPAWAGPVALYVGERIWATSVIALATILASLVAGGVIGILQTVRHCLLRVLLRIYIEVWRGFPMIVTLYLTFFALPMIGLRFNDLVAACIGISLWGSANVAEVVRGAIESIPAQQSIAAASVGLNWVQTMIYVLLPQAVRRALPPLVGLVANLILSSTLASVIGVQEVLGSANNSIQRLTLEAGDSHAAAILGAVMVFFFVVSFPITQLSQRLEKKFG